MNAHFFINGLEAAARWVFLTSLQASVLLLLVLLVQWLPGQRLPVKWSYALGLLVLIRLVLPFAPSSKLSIFNLQHAIRLEQGVGTSYTPASIVQMLTPQNLSTVKLERVQASSDPMRHIDWRLVAAFLWCGVFFLLFSKALIQHWKLSYWCSTQSRLRDPRLEQAIQSCRTRLKNCPELKAVSTPHLKTPALFGIRRPVLLLPEGILEALMPRELQLVLLHELVHHQRRDVMMNWAIIFVRSLHWFNPLVWLATKRLRLDQEMMCDSRVLELLSPEDRRCYGHTLLKLVTQFVPVRMEPSLVPLFKTIKAAERRIIMIANFNPASRLSVVLQPVLVIAVALSTFTSAAERNEPEKVDFTTTVLTQGAVDASVRARIAEVSAKTNGIGREVIKSELEKCDRSIATLEQQIVKLRSELADWTRATGGGLSEKELKEKLQYPALRVDAQAQYEKDSELLNRLKGLKPSELRRALPSAFPDVILNQCLKDEAEAEARFQELLKNYGEGSSEVLQARELASKSKLKTDDRIKGIMVGNEARVAALQQVVRNVDERMQKLSPKETEAFGKYQAYHAAENELQALKKFREVLAVRIPGGKD